MSSGVMRFRHAVVVSFADENTLSHGTEEPGIQCPLQGEIL